MHQRPFGGLFLAVLLGRLFLCGGVQGVTAQEASLEEGSTQTVGDARLRAAIRVQKSHEETLMAIPGVVAVGVGLTADKGEPALHVYFHTATVGASAAVVPRLAGHLSVRLIETDEIRALDGPPGNNHKSVFALPVPMGVSTGPSTIILAGTLGFRAHRSGQSSAVGYVTNNHVAAASGANACPAQMNPQRLPAFGLDQCQPGRFDTAGSACGTSPIGDLVQAIPLIMGGSFQNTVDAAFVTSSRSRVHKTILDIGAPSPTVQEPTIGLGVRKSGRTTGLTTGTIQTINTTVNVNYGTGCGTARFVGQIAITGPGGFSAAGDSGSLILGSLDSAGRRRPVGLLFAGSSTTTFANRIGDVLGALHVQIDTQ